MGSDQRIGEVWVKSIKRKRGGWLKKLEWHEHAFRLGVTVRPADVGNFYTLDCKMCRCDPTARRWESRAEVAENLVACGDCFGVASGTLRIVVAQDASEQARLSALLAYWGEDVLSADIGASALMDAAVALVKRYERNGLPGHVKDLGW